MCTGTLGDQVHHDINRIKGPYDARMRNSAKNFLAMLKGGSRRLLCRVLPVSGSTGGWIALGLGRRVVLRQCVPMSTMRIL